MNLFKQRSSEGAFSDMSPDGRSEVDLWDALPLVEPDVRRLDRGRVVAVSRKDPSFALFDLLRTRVLRALKEHGWSRIAVTSPTPKCGKTLVAANLAFSLSRLSACRSILLDMDLRIPSLSRLLGVPVSAGMGRFLAGEIHAADYLTRAQPNLGLGLSTASEPDASEILQHPATGARLRELQASFRPAVLVCDLPPLLACDDVLAFAPQVDAVLLVVRGGKTKPDEMRECERLLEGQVPLLGVVLNCAEDKPPKPYGYYGHG